MGVGGEAAARRCEECNSHLSVAPRYPTTPSSEDVLVELWCGTVPVFLKQQGSIIGVFQNQENICGAMVRYS